MFQWQSGISSAPIVSQRPWEGAFQHHPEFCIEVRAPVPFPLRMSLLYNLSSIQFLLVEFYSNVILFSSPYLPYKQARWRVCFDIFRCWSYMSNQASFVPSAFTTTFSALPPTSTLQRITCRQSAAENKVDTTLCASLESLMPPRLQQ